MSVLTSSPRNTPDIVPCKKRTKKPTLSSPRIWFGLAAFHLTPVHNSPALFLYIGSNFSWSGRRSRAIASPIRKNEWSEQTGTSFVWRMSSFILAGLHKYSMTTTKKQFDHGRSLRDSNTKFKTQEAELKLSTRAQKCSETVTDYVEDMLGLCKLVDVKMSEEDKVAHFLKCVVEEVFHFLCVKEIDTVDNFKNSSRHFEALCHDRVGAPRFERLQMWTA